jgi:integrase
MSAATDLGFNVFDYTPDRRDLPETNLEGLIKQSKSYHPYDAQEWDSSTWDLTPQEKKTRRQAGKRFRLIFACTHSKNGKRESARYFTPIFADLVKSLLVVRYIERGVGFGPQSTMLIAFRYIYQALGETWDGDVRKLSHGTFQLASDILRSREAESTCYRIGNSLQLISDTLTRFFVTPVPVAYKSPFKRSEMHDPLSERFVDRKSKLQLSEDAIEAILHLDKVVTEKSDRLIIELMKILMFTGMRISEILSLKHDALIEKIEDGQSYCGLRFYPAKGGHKITQTRWFGDLSEKLMKETFQSILDLTEEPRRVALWLKNNPDQTYLREMLPEKKTYSLGDFFESFGTKNFSSVSKILKTAKLKAPVNLDELDQAFCLKDKERIIFNSKSTGYTVEIQDALFLIFENTFSPIRNVRKFLPTLLQEGHISRVFNGKVGKAGKHATKSIFERYEIKGRDGEQLRLTTHMFRRFLTTLYNEGGVPLTILTKIFGRSNPKDTLSYIYTSPKEQTEKAREIFKSGLMIGPKADIANSLPVRERDSFIDTTVESVHHLGHGYCSHDWSTLPCEKHLQCLDKCVDFHVVKGDKKTKAYLLEQKHWAEKSLDSALAEDTDGTYGAKNHVEHYKRVIETVYKYLNEMEVVDEE